MNEYNRLSIGISSMMLFACLFRMEVPTASRLSLVMLSRFTLLLRAVSITNVTGRCQLPDALFLPEPNVYGVVIAIILKTIRCIEITQLTNGISNITYPEYGYSGGYRTLFVNYGL